MEIKDLRLGNYLQYRDKNSLLTVESLGSNGFSTINQDGIQYGSDDISEYNGIPLTEEWLLKFGFKDGEWESKTSSNCLCHVNGTLHISDARDVDYSFESPCNYVHQLQNLFFALTGEELQLK